MKIDVKKLAGQAWKVAGPIVAAVAIEHLMTGKVDVKAAIRKVVRDQLAD